MDKDPDSLKKETQKFKEKLEAVKTKFKDEYKQQIEELSQPNLTKDERRKITKDLQTNLDEKIDKALEEILPRAFAVFREATRRATGKFQYSVQLMGAYALYKGMIAEMATGEGKTLVAPMAAYLEALAGKGVHVITTTTTLAKNNKKTVEPIFELVGITVGCVANQNEMGIATRRQQYNCDVTYGANNIIGFDFLGDNSAYSENGVVLRGLPYAIVDEADKVLVDDARTSLIRSGRPVEQNDKNTDEKYKECAKIVKEGKLSVKVVSNQIFSEKVNYADYDFIVNERDHSAKVTERGYRNAEKLLGITNMLNGREKEEWVLHYLRDAVMAEYLYYGTTLVTDENGKEKGVIDQDKEDQGLRGYVVKGGKVVLLDSATRYPQEGMVLSYGMHQALEAKEGVKISPRTRTESSITPQNLYRMYYKLSGMTGTSAKDELATIYKLDTVEIPTNRLLIRNDLPDKVYQTKEDKRKAVIEEIIALHTKSYKDKNGQEFDGMPIVVGVGSVDESERLAQDLKKRGIEAQVLNAANAFDIEEENEKVAKAGRRGSVTIATIITRGTDIKIDEILELMDEIQEGAEGGLNILGTERFESERIDRQFRGRAGRNGEPGQSQFFVSLEDNLIKQYTDNKDIIKWLKNTTNLKELNKLKDKLEKSELTETAQIAEALKQAEPEQLKQLIKVFKLKKDADASQIAEALSKARPRQQENFRDIFGLGKDAPIDAIHITEALITARKEQIEKLRIMLDWKEGQPIKSNEIKKAFDDAQKKAEDNDFYIREEMLKYDNLINLQRLDFFEDRSEILSMSEAQASERLRGLCEQLTNEKMDEFMSGAPSDWDLKKLDIWLEQVFNIKGLLLEYKEDRPLANHQEKFREYILNSVTTAFNKRAASIAEDKKLDGFDKIVSLASMDSVWSDYLESIEKLKENAGYSKNQNPHHEFDINAQHEYEIIRGLANAETISRYFHVPVGPAEAEDKTEAKTEENPVQTSDVTEQEELEQAPKEKLTLDETTQGAMKEGEDLETRFLPFKELLKVSPDAINILIEAAKELKAGINHKDLHAINEGIKNYNALQADLRQMLGSWLNGGVFFSKLELGKIFISLIHGRIYVSEENKLIKQRFKQLIDLNKELRELQKEAKLGNPIKPFTQGTYRWLRIAFFLSSALMLLLSPLVILAMGFEWMKKKLSGANKEGDEGASTSTKIAMIPILVFQGVSGYNGLSQQAEALTL